MPGRRTCRDISEIIANAVNTKHPYTPSVEAPYRPKPWIATGTDREKALTGFDEKIKNFNPAQRLSMWRDYISTRPKLIERKELPTINENAPLDAQQDTPGATTSTATDLAGPNIAPM